MVEITDSDLRILTGSKALLDKLLQGKTRARQEALIKEHYPDTNTTQDIAEPFVKPLEEKIEKLSKDFADYRKEVQGKDLDTRLAKDIKYLQEQRDFTDEGIEKLKKMMIEREIPSIIDAADLWTHRNPARSQEPSTLSPSDWGFGKKTEDPDMKLLFEDEDAWAEKEARKAWAEETIKKGQILT